MMARIREDDRRWRATVRVDNTVAAVDRVVWFMVLGKGLAICFGTWFDVAISTKQARRLAKWINSRCDELESEATDAK